MKYVYDKNLMQNKQSYGSINIDKNGDDAGMSFDIALYEQKYNDESNLEDTDKIALYNWEQNMFKPVGTKKLGKLSAVTVYTVAVVQVCKKLN